MHDTRRAGIASILAGALFFVGQGGELVFDEPIHDPGLLVFEAAWVVLGVVLIRRGGDASTA